MNDPHLSCVGSEMLDQKLEEAKRAYDRNAWLEAFQPRTLSDRALELINGPRAEMYDEPARNLERIGAMWGAILKREEPVESWRVALMMCALKVARAAHQPNDEALVDLVGYAELVARLRD